MGYSLWTIPLPAVIHWTPPGPMTPEFPIMSPCSTRPLSMIVHVSKPRWGWSGKPISASLEGLLNSSSMRNGSRFRSLEVPTVL